MVFHGGGGFFLLSKVMILLYPGKKSCTLCVIKAKPCHMPGKKRVCNTGRSLNVLGIVLICLPVLVVVDAVGLGFGKPCPSFVTAANQSNRQCWNGPHLDNSQAASTQPHMPHGEAAGRPRVAATLI